VLVEEHGIPLSLIVTGANRHDITQFKALLDSIVIARPKASEEAPQNLCADKGYDSKEARQTSLDLGFTPHIRARGEEQHDKQTIPGYRARRWVVESCNSWFNRFRKLLVRFEKKHTNYVALMCLACAMIAFRKVLIIYG